MNLMDVAAQQIASDLNGGPSVFTKAYEGAANRSMQLESNRLELQNKLEQQRAMSGLSRITREAGKIQDEASRMDYLARAYMTIDPKLALDYAKSADTARYHSSMATSRGLEAQVKKNDQVIDMLAGVDSQATLDGLREYARGTPLEGRLPTDFTPETGKQLRALSDSAGKVNKTLRDKLANERVITEQARQRELDKQRELHESHKRNLDLRTKRLSEGLPETPSKGGNEAVSPYRRAIAGASVRDVPQAAAERLDRAIRSRLGLDTMDNTPDEATNLAVSDLIRRVHMLTLRNMAEQDENGEQVDRDAAERAALKEAMRGRKVEKPATWFGLGEGKPRLVADQAELTNMADEIRQRFESGELTEEEATEELDNLADQGWVN